MINNNSKALDLITSLQSMGNVERKKAVEYYFKTGKGQYAEGDVFLGITNPDLRSETRKYLSLDYKEIQILLDTPLHEVRCAGLLILTENAKKAARKKDIKSLEEISDFYLGNIKAINNWDLVDLSCIGILANAINLGAKKIEILYELSSSPNMWARRISIITTLGFVRNGDLTDAITLSKILLNNKEDLMHKAVGWVLREVWKSDHVVCESFLLDHYDLIPRTALRYAIEKMEETKRLHFLNLRKKK